MKVPAAEVLDAFRRNVRANDPGIGILDTRSGEIYLAVASRVPGGDHASLAEMALGVIDVDEATMLRGFVVGVHDGSWQFVNNSGLNPVDNRMEAELFEELVAMLSAALGPAVL